MTNYPIRICHTVSSLASTSGGPARTVTQLASELSLVSDIEILLTSQQCRKTPLVDFTPNNTKLLVAQSNSLFLCNAGMPTYKAVTKICTEEKPHIIHNHGIWLPANHWPAATARRFNIPLVLHPRGMLEPWAINHHGFKKKIAMALFQKEDIETAAVIMATSNDEHKNIRALGFRNPIAVIPNGIVFDEDANYEAKTSGKNSKTALFLSRIHPKKGLINLVNAWAQVKPDGWKLQIAGPDEGGHQVEIMRLIQQLNLEEQISFIGEVDGTEKRNAYIDADLFVLPTFSENFGVVVAEALSYGVPVITTTGTPWQDLQTYGCGWWIDTGVDPLVRALKDATALTTEQRHEMGEKGRQYVQRYNWHDIARQTADVYRWILGQADKPDCVYLD